MPILGTGKIKIYDQLGYTLIEILAVLILLCLIGLLAFPRFFGGEEKAYLNQIGKLVRVDLNTVKEEAFCGKQEIVVTFFENGYTFNIGEVEIRRVFDKFQFHWKAPLEAAELTEPVESSEIIEDNNENETEPESGNFELSFNNDSDLTETKLHWTTNHYQGNILLKADGSVSWDYEPK